MGRPTEGGSSGSCLASPGATLDITSCFFSQNFGVNNSASGGAIENQGDLTIRLTTFDYNISNISHGGAIYHEGSSMVISDSTFTNSHADAGNGGAIFSASTMPRWRLLGEEYPAPVNPAESALTKIRP